MPKTIPPLQEHKKLFHRRNGSGEFHTFAGYFETTNSAFTHKNYMKEGVGRLSLDIPNNRSRNSIPLHDMIMENRNPIPLQTAIIMDHNPMLIKNEKKHKQPSSPGGKLAHFLNSLFNQTSSKKSKSKSITTTQSTKNEDESPSGWRRKRRSSISLFRSGNGNTNIVSDTKSTLSKTPPTCQISQVPLKSSSYKDYNTPSDITKLSTNENQNKNGNFKIKTGLFKKSSSENGLLEKSKICDVKHDEHHQKYDATMAIKELKRFILDDDGDSDSSSDLFELTTCDLGYNSSGLPVFETTHIDSIKRGAPICS
ncbi:uncharacterized protein [Rutidosis leptorrhynchoides]|uniref:uncharacterized protein n=1 Tax=Rutidosis leptorrhynchoides TaxID=125765 RepID=UPI003A9A2B6E